MTILVIGGAGYIGSNVVDFLSQNALNDKNKVIVLDNLSTGFKLAIANNAHFYEGDILDHNLLVKIFKTHKVDIVIHLAAKLLVDESVKKPLEYYQTNVGGLINLLTVMRDFNVKNLIFSSTAAVYGIPEKQTALLESDITDPINPYGSSKLSCEYLIKAAQHAYGLNYVIFRYFNVAGANLSANIGQSNNKKLTHLIPVMIDAILKSKKPLVIYGNDYNTPDQTCVRDYIHVLDLAHAHFLAIQFLSKSQSGTFNLGSNHGFSIKQVVETAQNVLKIKVPYIYGQRRAGDPPFLVANAAKAQQVLGFKPKYNLTDMIKSEYNWRKNVKY